MSTGITEQYSIGDYLLVAEPHEALRDSIMQLKKKFADTYECPAAAFGKPHITLAKFRQFEMMEPRIVQHMSNIIMTSAPFLVELHDFGSFPTHTIYINITTKTGFTQLVRSLRPLQKMMKLDKENKPHFITDPHLTIARKLLPWQYEQGWLEYSHTPFTGKFMTDHLLLLKKKAGDKRYDIVKRFMLMDKRTVTEQASLF